MAVDTLGLVWALMVVPADTQDRAGGVPLMDRLRAAVKRLKLVWGDSHFDTALTHGWIKWGWVGVVVKKLAGQTGFVVQDRRADVRVARPVPPAGEGVRADGGEQ